ncbi:hypothetical protein CLV47_101506 [Antricoccus suffuscus]|uniref:DUF985 domain-containing protein n=1 Tax=Antricoccus suffuscus TaxID=1629062 RepID=A0A2T1A710_9ACTN|nr:cupin domain-containing protein [Antricoccus suffuscus]PRZ44380.1 hypothetical protein CLV47_101506 [Antricoccus suffuscus]
MYQFNADDLTDPAALGMQPHPEGGWYVEHYRNPQDVATPNGPRGLATAISFLLQPGQESAWHRVRSDELWFWQGGGPLELDLGGDGARPGDATTYTLGLGGQLLVPANVWQAARPAGDETVIVGCVVTPGFDFADFELA